MKAIKQLLHALGAPSAFLTALLLAAMLPQQAAAYTLTLQATPAKGGSAYIFNTSKVSGEYDEDAIIKVSASESSGFKFVGWYENDNTSPSSTDETFEYHMPGADVTLTARFIYDPTLPDEPVAPVIPDPTYKVTVKASPSNSAGSVSISGTYNNYLTATAGTIKTITASASSNWRFAEWRDDQGTLLSTEPSFSYTFPERNVVLTAYFAYNPGAPEEPGYINNWDPITGEIIILKIKDNSLSQTCNALITSSECAQVKKIVIADPDYSSAGASISYIRSNLSNVEVVDLQKSAYIDFSSYDLGIKSMKKLVLPAATNSFHSDTFAMSNSQLQEIWIYAVTPPVLSRNIFTNVSNTCVIYVPNESVAAYQAAPYWSNFTILPMVSEVNAVGPDDPDWDNLSLLHKIPFSLTYSGPDGAAIEYQCEEDGEWHTLRNGIADGDEINCNALVTFQRSRLVHTVDYRVNNAGSITPLPEKRIELVDLTYRPLSIPGTWLYDYGNPIEPEVLIDGLDPGDFNVGYLNNTVVGRATAKASGKFPASIGSRSNTFDIKPLPLPGSVEFSDPDVSLVYRNEDIKPEWRFTDPRNASLVESKDYTVKYENCRYVGTATLTVTGKGNFTGSITYDYEIVKGPVLEAAYTLYLTYPDEEILYDGNPHGFSPWGASLPTYYGAGRYYKYYDHETHDELPVAPSEPGVYEGWIGFGEGPNTLAADPVCRIVYTIFKMEDSEWEALQELSDDLAERGFTTGWSFSNKLNALRFNGIKMKLGEVTEISFPGKTMIGTFPRSVLAFSALKRLDLSGNRLSGTFGDISDVLPGVEYVDISDNILSGDLALLADIFPGVTTLKASNNRFSMINKPLPASIATLEYGGQTTGVTVDLDYTDSDLTAFYSAFPSIVRYNHSNGTYGLVTDLWITTSPYNDIALLPNSSWAAKLTATGIEKVSDNVIFTGTNGGLIRCLTADNINFNANFSFLRGDADFDVRVSVLDLQATINCIFDELDPNAPFNLTAADTRTDSSINVFDVVTTVALMLSAPHPAPARPMRTESSDSPAPGDGCRDCIAAGVYVSDGYLKVTTEVPVSAIDVQVSGATFAKRQPLLDALGFNYSVCGNRLVAYSLGGATIPVGTTELAEVPAGSAVSAVMLSDARAKEIPAATAVVSSIGDINNDSNADGEWFTLQGVRINAPTLPGIYIHNNRKTFIK